MPPFIAIRREILAALGVLHKLVDMRTELAHVAPVVQQDSEPRGEL